MLSGWYVQDVCVVLCSGYVRGVGMYVVCVCAVCGGSVCCEVYVLCVYIAYVLGMCVGCVRLGMALGM